MIPEGEGSTVCLAILHVLCLLAVGMIPEGEGSTVCLAILL